MKKSKIIISIFIGLAVVGSLLWVKNKKKLEPERKAQDTIVPLAKKISKKWINGGNMGEISRCLAFKDISKDIVQRFSRCNKEFLKCWLKESKYKKFSFNRGYILTLTENGKDYQFKLDNKCHMAYLPQGFYSAGVKEEQKYLWDNFHEHVYIDKYYVSNADIKEWKKNEKLSYNNKAYMTDSISEMKAYCKSRGKELLQAHYFDAASFLVKRDARTNYYYKSNYHFKRGRTFLESNKKLTKKNCYNAYIKGCEKFFDFENYKTIAQSWIGINYILGGHPEFLLNKFDLEKSLKTSSLNEERKSISHRIGYREKLGNRKGAFRCMLRR